MSRLWPCSLFVLAYFATVEVPTVIAVWPSPSGPDAWITRTVMIFVPSVR